MRWGSYCPGAACDGNVKSLLLKGKDCNRGSTFIMDDGEAGVAALRRNGAVQGASGGASKSSNSELGVKSNHVPRQAGHQETKVKATISIVLLSNGYPDVKKSNLTVKHTHLTHAHSSAVNVMSRLVALAAMFPLLSFLSHQLQYYPNIPHSRPAIARLIVQASSLRGVISVVFCCKILALR